MKPVHILMPAYNVEKYIGKAIQSFLDQDYRNTKLIIIDDGSTDKTIETIDGYLKWFPGQIIVKINSHNEGLAVTRKKLWDLSKEIDPNAYIGWLYADDSYTAPNILSSIMTQMLRTGAEVCLLNFTVAYEDETQRQNAAGLRCDLANHQELLKTIDGSVSPLSRDLEKVTTLGWAKFYSPTAKFYEPLPLPYEDFISLASVYLASSVTALRTPAIEFFRRSSSLVGQRTAENFTVHIPAQLEHLFGTIYEQTRGFDEVQRLELLKRVAGSVTNKIDQYMTTLGDIVATRKRTDINQSTLEHYKDLATKLEDKMSVSLKALSEEKEERVLAGVPGCRP